MDCSNNLDDVNVIEVHYLAAVVKNNLEGVLVIDSRSFLEYNTTHVINTVNVSCSKIVKRRLQQDKLSIKELLAHTCQCEADDSCDVIVYDQNSTHTSSVPVDSFLHVLLKKLMPVFRSVNLVCGGFLEFQASYPSLLEHNRRKSSTLTSVSQPCLPVTNLGPTKILPFVYLGSQSDALNKEIVQQYNITYELNVSTSCPKPDFISDNQFMRIPVNDNYSEKLIPYFPAAFQFLDRVRESNACILIHCLAGISRSATVAIAYVMKHLRMTSDDAYRYVKSKRATISPNFNFLGQLLEYERQLKSLQVLSLESGFSSAVVVSETNQKKRPCSSEYSPKIRSLSLTIPETSGFNFPSASDQSPTTALSKLSFETAEEPEEKCPCLLKRRKEEQIDQPKSLPRPSYPTPSCDNYLSKSNLSKSHKFDFSSSLNSYQASRSSSDNLKLDNFDLEVQGIPFSSLSELSFTPCQTSASSSASNSHEGTPERSFGFPRLINRRAGSEARIYSKSDFYRTDHDLKSRRSPSSISACSSQKSSRRGSGTTDDDSDSLLRNYGSSSWYIPTLEALESDSCFRRKLSQNDSIGTSGFGSEVSDLLSDVRSTCESLVSDASCSSLCSSISRGNSLGSRHDFLRPLSVSSSSDAMTTDNDSDCGEGHLSDVEEEIEEEDESLVYKLDLQSTFQEMMKTKRSSSDSAYQSLNEGSGPNTERANPGKEFICIPEHADGFIELPACPIRTEFLTDLMAGPQSCSTKNDSGTKMDVDNLLKMLETEQNDSLGTSHDSGISLSSTQSPHWNESKEFKPVALDEVSEEPAIEKPQTSTEEAPNNNNNSNVNNIPCDNVKKLVKDKKWEDILKEKLAFFTSLTKELKNEFQRHTASNNMKLYRAQSCPGILGILMQGATPPVVLDSKGLLRQKVSNGCSKVLNKFKNRYSCGSLDFLFDENKMVASFESCPEAINIDSSTNEKNSSSSLSPSHQPTFNSGCNIIQVS